MGNRLLLLLVLVLAVSSCSNRACNEREKPNAWPFPHAGIVAR
jgi:hypothetical protein